MPARGVHVDQVGLAVRVRVHSAALEPHLPMPLAVLGKALAEQAMSHVQGTDEGYYPALDYLHDQGIIEPGLYETAAEAGWLAARMVREAVQTRLRPVVAGLRYQSISCTAFTLPAVRPRDPNALAHLAEHYTPDTVKMDLLLTILQRAEVEEGLERASIQLVFRWLEPEFADLSVSGAHRL